MHCPDDDRVIKMDLKIGMEFASFADFESAFQIYQKQKFLNFSTFDSKSLIRAKRKFLTPRVQNAQPELKYIYIKYICVHGGLHKRKETTGERNSSTMRMNCEAFIVLKLSYEGNSLVICKFIDTHNHEVSSELFEYLPKQRRLNPETQQEIVKLLRIKANKNLIQEKYCALTGKNIILRDLSKIKAKSKKATIEEIIQDLQMSYNCVVKILLDDKKILQSIYIQDTQMMSDFNKYPELLFVDCTYKLTDIRAPIFVMMVENGNGESVIVAAGVFITEEQKNYRWFLKTFKELNPASSQTHIVMTDKDSNETIFNNIKDQWTAICDSRFPTFLNGTNNRVENFNSQLKSVVSRFSSFEIFFKNFFSVVKCNRLEHAARAAKVFTKKSTETLSPDENNYYKALTPYAYNLVKQQLDAAGTIDVETLNEYKTHEMFCQCIFARCMQLPCKHIFTYRVLNKMRIYEECLISRRWSRSYFYDSVCSKEPDESGPSPMVDIEQEPRVAILTTAQKLEKALAITNKLAEVMSESPFFHEQMAFQQSVYDSWANGKVALEIKEIDAKSINILPPTSNAESFPEVLQTGVIVPTRVKVRGRPKGVRATVIGLSNKKRRRSSAPSSTITSSISEGRDSSIFQNHNVLDPFEAMKRSVDSFPIRGSSSTFTNSIVGDIHVRDFNPPSITMSPTVVRL